MTMDTGHYRIELSKITGRSIRPDKSVFKYTWIGFVGFPVVLIAGLGALMLLCSSGDTDDVEPIKLTAVATAEPAVPSAAGIAQSESSPGSSNASVESQPVTAPAEASPVEGLKISWQSWRRGGLGSNALVSFTLRNANDYAVKEIEIACSFTRRDGSHLTDRKRIIHDTINMKSRKSFLRMHVGFVNVNADRAKCSPVAASRA